MTVEPTVGRIVHYTMHEREIGDPRFGQSLDGGPARGPLAALIVEVASDGITKLLLFTVDGDRCLRAVPQSDEPRPGFWSWPPRG